MSGGGREAIGRRPGDKQEAEGSQAAFRKHPDGTRKHTGDIRVSCKAPRSHPEVRQATARGTQQTQKAFKKHPAPRRPPGDTQQAPARYPCRSYPGGSQEAAGRGTRKPRHIHANPSKSI